METEISYRHIFITAGLMNDPLIVITGGLFLMAMILMWLWFEGR